jgi:probable F420-dependent oxidoreductase
VKVRVGLGLGTQGLADDGRFAGIVDDLERLRFDSLWVSERITGPAPDPVVAMAFAAGRTAHLKFGMSVMVLPGRNPVLLAKALASLDRLSDGRLLPAFGLGIVDPAEQQAFGVAREERAAWFDEALPLLRRFWTEDVVDHEGPRFRYEGMRVLPKPAQKPPDVWLGGRAPGELRRVGRLGDGWLPSFCTPQQVAAGRAIVEEAAAGAGRAIDPEHFGALVVYGPDGGLPEPVVQAITARRRNVLDGTTSVEDVIPSGHTALRARLEEFIAVGFSKLVVLPLVEPSSWTDELEALAETVLPLST